MYALELNERDRMRERAPLRVLNVSRRTFLKTSALAAGSTFVLGMFAGCSPENRNSWPDKAAATGDLSDAAFRPSVFIGLNSSGDVFIVCSRSEMGQGIRTGVPAVIADEMGADWDRVHILQADGHPRFGNQNTDGSRSMRRHFDDWRTAGATARMMLIQAAAARWEVSEDECEAEGNLVRHAASGQELGFGELAAEAALLDVPVDPAFKPREKWRYIGRELSNIDNRAFVTGAAKYGIDVRIPGMKFAAIARSPVLGGTLSSVDDSDARATPGVVDVVRLDDVTVPAAFKALGGVAVIADNTWAAFKGRDALNLVWDRGPNASYGSEDYREALLASVSASGETVRTEGAIDPAFAEAAQTVEALYHVPMLPHASMEPPVATAWVKDDGSCEIWAASQAPQTARGEVAGTLGVDPENVVVHVTYLGGGFGRKSKPDYVVEAALLSRAAGGPIQVVWSREDDLRHDYFHPPSAQYMKAGLDASGRVVSWLHRSAFPSISSTFAPGVVRPSRGDLSQGMWNVPYDIPNMQCESCEAPAHVRIGWLRSVYNIHHGFSANAFAAELAHAAGRDAKDYLLELIGEDRVLTELFRGGRPLDTARLKNVIRIAAREAGWGQPLEAGHAMGIAGHYSFESYVAYAVEASVESGAVRVHRVYCAVDCGTAVNLDRIRSQMEGATVFGLTIALKDGITARNGAVTTGNFDTYRLALMSDTPETHVHIVDSAELPGGVGEPGLPPLAGALAGAVLAATGSPVRDLPIRL